LGFSEKKGEIASATFSRHANDALSKREHADAGQLLP
jgi:hypothetical protein